MSAILCWKCNAPTSVLHKFCSNCGAPAREEFRTEDHISIQKRKKKIVKKVHTRSKEEIDREKIETRKRLARERSKQVKRCIQDFLATPLSVMYRTVYSAMMAMAWSAILLCTLYYGFLIGLRQRCGWEGGEIYCYIGLWEKISRFAVPLTVALICCDPIEACNRRLFGSLRSSSTSIDRTFFWWRRTFGLPLLLLGVIGFDGSHHRNLVLRNSTTALYLLIWTIFELLRHGAEATSRCRRVRVFHVGYRTCRRWIPSILAIVEAIVLLRAAAESRRIFAFPAIRDTDEVLWREIEGAALMPASFLEYVRYAASLYAVVSWIDTAKALWAWSACRKRRIKVGGSDD